MPSQSVYASRSRNTNPCSSSQHPYDDSIDHLSTYSCGTCSLEGEGELPSITRDKENGHQATGFSAFTTVHTFNDALFYVGMISTMLEITDDESIRSTAYSLPLNEKPDAKLDQTINMAAESGDGKEATPLLVKKKWRTSVTRKKGCEDLKAAYMKAGARSISYGQLEVKEAIPFKSPRLPPKRSKDFSNPSFLLPPLQLFPKYQYFVHNEDTCQGKARPHRAQAPATPRRLKSTSMLNLPASPQSNATSMAPSPRSSSVIGQSFRALQTL